MKLKRALCAVGVAAAWLVFGGCAFAGVVYDNTALLTSGGDFILGTTLFNSFSTGVASGAFSDLELGLADGLPSDGGTIIVALYGDDTSCGGLGTSDCPGTFITNLATILDSSLTDNAAIITASLTANPTLSAGTRYWIALNGAAVSANGPLWETASAVSGTGVGGEFVATGDYPYTGTFGADADSSLNRPYVMQVTVGSSAPPSAPEPGSLWLCMGGLGATLIALRRRRVR